MTYWFPAPVHRLKSRERQTTNRTYQTQEKSVLEASQLTGRWSPWDHQWPHCKRVSLYDMQQNYLSHLSFTSQTAPSVYSSAKRRKRVLCVLTFYNISSEYREFSISCDGLGEFQHWICERHGGITSRFAVGTSRDGRRTRVIPIISTTNWFRAIRLRARLYICLINNRFYKDEWTYRVFTIYMNIAEVDDLKGRLSRRYPHFRVQRHICSQGEGVLVHSRRLA